MASRTDLVSCVVAAIVEYELVIEEEVEEEGGGVLERVEGEVLESRIGDGDEARRLLL